VLFTCSVAVGLYSIVVPTKAVFGGFQDLMRRMRVARNVFNSSFFGLFGMLHMVAMGEKGGKTSQNVAVSHINCGSCGSFCVKDSLKLSLSWQED